MANKEHAIYYKVQARYVINDLRQRSACITYESKDAATREFNRVKTEFFKSVGLYHVSKRNEVAVTYRDTPKSVCFLSKSPKIMFWLDIYEYVVPHLSNDNEHISIFANALVRSVDHPDLVLRANETVISGQPYNATVLSGNIEDVNTTTKWEHLSYEEAVKYDKV